MQILRAIVQMLPPKLRNKLTNGLLENLSPSVTQMHRSRKHFLPVNLPIKKLMQLLTKLPYKLFFTILFTLTFSVTLLLHNFLNIWLSPDQQGAIAQIQSTVGNANAPNLIVPNLQSNIQRTVPLPVPNKPAIRTEIRGVWLTNNDFAMFSDRQKLATSLRELQQLNFNTIYPVVWNSGYVMFPSEVAKREEIQDFVYRGNEGHDIVEDIITQAHRHNLLVMPWFEFGFMAPLMSELATKHPHWLTQQRNGAKTSVTAAGEVAWLNPFHPEVQKFLTDLVLEAVNNYDLDGIQFDDHTSLPKTFGYDRYTLDLYRRETKKEAPANVDDPEWVRWRANKITAFMASLSKAAKQRKPNLIFSVSPNYHDFAYKQQLQDWLTWVRQGTVDELIVQVYRSDIDDFRSQITRPEILEVQAKIPTAIGVLSGLRNNQVPISRVFSQVFTAQRQGLGVSFFYYRSLWGYGPEEMADRQRELQYLFRNPAPRISLRSQV
jgi:uncharacterized lipoprotein YddW (UPF0748 family)